MYHDQGLTPFKALSFETGVNFTGGLKFIRTSPDHGTAYNIAGKNVASESSLRSAIFLAKEIYYSRNHLLAEKTAWNALNKQFIKKKFILIYRLITFASQFSEKENG